MSLREPRTIRERFGDVLFLTERDDGMAGIYEMALVLTAHLTDAQLREILIDTGWAEAVLTKQEASQ